MGATQSLKKAIEDNDLPATLAALKEGADIFAIDKVRDVNLVVGLSARLWLFSCALVADCSELLLLKLSPLRASFS